MFFELFGMTNQFGQVPDALAVPQGPSGCAATFHGSRPAGNARGRPSASCPPPALPGVPRGSRAEAGRPIGVGPERAGAVDDVDVALVLLVQPRHEEVEHLDVFLGVDRVSQLVRVGELRAVERRPDAIVSVRGGRKPAISSRSPSQRVNSLESLRISSQVLGKVPDRRDAFASNSSSLYHMP